MIKRRKKTEIELTINNIRDDGYHIFVYISINGHYTRMLLDTGASRTVFDLNWLKQIHADIEMEENEDKATGLGADGVENFIVFLEEIIVGQFVLESYQAGALQLDHVNNSYQSLSLPPIGGVLGSDILVLYCGIIDLGKRKLILYSYPEMETVD